MSFCTANINQVDALIETREPANILNNLLAALQIFDTWSEQEKFIVNTFDTILEFIKRSNMYNALIKQLCECEFLYKYFCIFVNNSLDEYINSFSENILISVYLYFIIISLTYRPIKMAFSKIKNFVKKRDNSTEEKLYKNIKKGIKSLHGNDLQNFFNKSFS